MRLPARPGLCLRLATCIVALCHSCFDECCLRIKFDQMPQLLKLRKGEFQQLGPQSVLMSVTESIATGWTSVAAAALVE